MSFYPLKAEAYEPHPQFRTEILALESELDDLLPLWERTVMHRSLPSSGGPRTFAIHAVRSPGYSDSYRSKHGLVPLTDDHYKRLKWVLKRHLMLNQGRDWGAFLVPHPPGDSRRFSCHPRQNAQQNPDEEPPRVDCRGVQWPDMTRRIPVRLRPAEIAWELRLSKERVEKALEVMPVGQDPLEWCRTWKEEG